MYYPVFLFTLSPNFLVDDDIFLYESPCNQMHKPAVEFGAHGSDRKEKVRALTPLDMMPYITFIHSTSRHNTVYVRMVERYRLRLCEADMKQVVVLPQQSNYYG